MGITALVGGALGVFGSVKAASSQRKAADRAAEATENASREQVALQREIYQQQRQDLEPFRQQEIQRANALGEIFGFTPVGGQGQSAPMQAAQRSPGFSGGQFGGQSVFNPRAYLDANPDVRQHFGGIDPNTRAALAQQGYSGEDGWARFHYDRVGRSEGREGAFGAAPSRFNPSTLYEQPEPITMDSQQDAARARFEGSMFNDVYRDGHARDVTKIDSGLASQGLAFSGARMQAVEDARADRFGSTFNSYMASLMGQAPTTATQSTNAAAGAFGANASNAIGQAGAAQAQSAYAKGQANAGLWNGLAGFGGYMMGGGFG